MFGGSKAKGGCAGGVRWAVFACVCSRFQWILLSASYFQPFSCHKGGGAGWRRVRDWRRVRGRAQRGTGRPNRPSAKGGGRDAARRLVSPCLAIAPNPTKTTPVSEFGSGLVTFFATWREGLRPPSFRGLNVMKTFKPPWPLTFLRVRA